MKRPKIVAIAGALLAVLGMLLAYLYTGTAKKGGPGDSAASSGTAPAYVAKSDLSVGTKWEDMADLVEKQRVPLSLRPAGAISSPAQVKQKTLVRSMSKGEILTTVQFNNSGAESLKIPPGQSALTLSLPSPPGVADYIQPGSKANFFVTFKSVPGEADGGPMTKLLLSDITVLANRKALPAKARAEEPQGDTGSEILLTFAVTIDQAERIIFAKENGSVWLTLMAPGDPPGTGGGSTFTTVLL